MKRITLVLEDDDHELVRRVAERHGLTPTRYAVVTVLREAVISAGLEDQDSDAPKRALPTLPPPRSK